MRVLIYGNAGSGKTTYAKRLARTHGLQHLDLDAIVWEPGKIAVLRPAETVRAELQAFIDEHSRWVIEGCYADLVEMASADCTELVFLNPGEAACVAHCLARPWEPHKYASEVEQDRMLGPLLDWVRGYYHRDDAWSLVAHRRLFASFDGPRRELTEPVPLPRDAD
jgi:adenylate kinase family enzyme